VWAATETRHNQVWVGDITYLRLAEGWRYLTIVLDHHARRVIALTFASMRNMRRNLLLLARAAGRVMGSNDQMTSLQALGSPIGAANGCETRRRPR